MAAISTHPRTLRTLKFRGIYSVDGRGSSSSEKRDRTKAVADMLLVNKHVDEIRFCCGVSFDRDDCNALVAPRVECTGMHSSPRELSAISIGSGLLQSRRYRNRQPVLQAFARVEKKPSLVRMDDPL
jgi:hypothetical protein